MIRIPTSNIAPGQRLAHDVFFADGRLLLGRGRPVASNEEAALIRDCGYCRQPAGGPNATFEAMAAIADRLSQCYREIADGVSAGDWQRRLTALAGDFIALVDGDPDAAFASVHVNVRHPYLVVHSLMAAIVCGRLSLLGNFSPPQRRSLVGAALTHDLGLLCLQSRINASESLGDEERRLVARHPALGQEILGSLGIDDPLWLDAVGDHHEYLDGSGYQGKQGEKITSFTRIIALADAYSAMLRPRPYRERIYASEALETLYANERHRYDGALLETLIWDYGFHPPGCMLRLANRELAVALGNTPSLLDAPLAAALTDSRGRPRATPAIRDTNEAAYAIVAVLDPAMAARAGQLLGTCWNRQKSETRAVR